MQPKMCTKCKKNIAVVFITKIENGVTLNEGYCLRCARSLGIPQIDQAVKQMGISEDDLDLLSDEMSNMFGQRESGDGEEDEIDSQTSSESAFWQQQQFTCSAQSPCSQEGRTQGRARRKGEKEIQKA